MLTLTLFDQLDVYWLPLLVLGILIVTIVSERLIRKLFDRVILQSSLIIRNDPTQYQFLKYLVSAGIFVTGIGFSVYVIPSLRAISVSLLAGAGIFAAAAGLASQQAFSNIVGGVFLVIFKPFGIGDRLQIGTDIAGFVEDITLRHTVIRNFENQRIIVPNSTISSTTIINSNFEDQRKCRFVNFRVALDSDFNRAKQIMQELAESHPLCIDNRSDEEKEEGLPKVHTRIVEVGEYFCLIRAWVWAENAGDAFVISCDLNQSVLERFRAEGIEVPVPQRKVFQGGV